MIHSVLIGARNTISILKKLAAFGVLGFAMSATQSAISAPGPADVFASAFQSADSSGMVRVIVTLKDADVELSAIRDASVHRSHRLAGPGNVTLSGLSNQGLRRAAIARNQNKALQNLRQGSYRIARQFEALPFVALSVTRDGLDQLLDDSSVTVSPERMFRPLLNTSVPLILEDKNFDDSPGYDPSLAGNSDRGEGWAVAIIDTGIEKTHSLLGVRVISEACYTSVLQGSQAPAQCPGADPTVSTAEDSGLPCDTNIDPICSHGTLMAGVVAADGDSGSYDFDGVATAADLISINVFSLYDPASPEPGNDSQYMTALSSDIILGLDHVYALQQDGLNISAVLISLGDVIESQNCDVSSPEFKIAIDRLKQIGVATIVASGNEGYSSGVNVPACISSAISVGASDDSDVKLPDSNEGVGLVDFYAPGVDIVSIDIGNAVSPAGEGTSYAAAHVAGAWAVLKQVSPNATVQQISSVLSDTGVNLNPVSPSGAKRINLHAAVGVGTLEPDDTTFYVIPLPQGGAAVFGL